MPPTAKKARRGARSRPVDLATVYNWPGARSREAWWRDLAARVAAYPCGRQEPWGIPFLMGAGKGRRVIVVSKRRPDVTIALGGKADFVCVLHEWPQKPCDVMRADRAQEGRPVGRYEFVYSDGSTHVHAIRARFEVTMLDSPGPAWLARPFRMELPVDPLSPPPEMAWGEAQPGFYGTIWTPPNWSPTLCAIPNPHPEKRLAALIVHCLTQSPLVVAGVTLYRGTSNPLRHLPRRTYRLAAPGEAPKIRQASVDLGCLVRMEQAEPPCTKEWLASTCAGVSLLDTRHGRRESLMEATGAEDATLSVQVAGRRRPFRFLLGDAFHRGQCRSACGMARLETLDRRRQWVQVTVRDAATGEPVPVRIRICGPHGNYLPPYGHHAVVNSNFLEDTSADVVAGGRSYAYVPGEFPMELPLGPVYVEMSKGFEYKPVRVKVVIRHGQERLDLSIERALNWRRKGWVSSDTHAHVLSAQTAWLEGQGEGLNVVGVLATQWGRLFTNVGDFTPEPAGAVDDTIVYVGSENRHPVMGHVSLHGVRGAPVYPMCSGGPREAGLGEPDFMSMTEWALECRRRGGLVTLPHFTSCGHTEEPVLIIKELADAVELGVREEWYGYLNCGYRVAVAGGTDRMGAYVPLGLGRTYARLDTKRPFDFQNWADAVRAGRTFVTSGPLLDLTVDGNCLGESLGLDASGGTVHVEAFAESVWPLSAIEIVCNGEVAATKPPTRHASSVRLKASLRVDRSGWIAARCGGAHTSPIYVTCGDTRAFDRQAAQHMLALVNGGIAYLEDLSTPFSKASLARTIKLFQEARAELMGRLRLEG